MKLSLARLPRSRLFRLSRRLHGWLSALAFLMLMFFAATGLLLNHPDWFDGEKQEHIQTLTVPETLARHWQQQENPSAEVLAYVRQQLELTGRFQSSEVSDGELMIRLESPAGSSDIWLRPEDHLIEVTRKPALAISLLTELHRGKNTGAGWRWLIDLSAVIIGVLSLLGYVLYFSMRKRLGHHLLLTVGSLVALVSLAFWSI